MVKLKQSVQTNEIFSQITPDDLAAVHRTLQYQYRSVRKENIKLKRMLKKTFRKHPLVKRGKGWMYHYCGRDCYWQRTWPEYRKFVHHFKSDEA